MNKFLIKIAYIYAVVCLITITSCNRISQQSNTLVLNDLEYFESQGVSLLVYSNQFTGVFNDEKTAGIELIHHGVRTSTGGAVRLSSTPEQWDLIPAITNRKADKESNSIETTLKYADYDFESRVMVTAKGKSFEISVYLDKPVPAALEKNAGFNLEFLPSAYFGKIYLMDGRSHLFPRHPVGSSVLRPMSERSRQFSGYSTSDDRQTGHFIEPLPLETGRTIIMAPEAPERTVKITSHDVDMMIYDGRMLAQNGWYVIRSLLPAGKTGKVLTWTMEANAIDGWIREPNIGFSQVGYIPSQSKVSVIELDKKDKPMAKASLYKIADDGKTTKVFSGNILSWGDFYKYNYVKFDFSPVKTPGIYYIQYGNKKTNTFLIDNNVYDDITNATTDVWYPVHMDHMTTNEAYRVWHGEPFKDDAIQAPILKFRHFDGYSQTTNHPKYKPYERIPGLNIGGWFDAGDYDIQTGTHNNVAMNFINIWEYFRPMRDQTFVDRKSRYVDIHRPDGIPDILQQVEQGTLQLVAQAENIGYMARGIVAPVLDQYHHLGDASTQTDGLPYNQKLGPLENDGRSSGRLDDRWVFDDRSAYTDISTAATLAAASRTLKGLNDDLSVRALKEAKRLYKEGMELLANQTQARTPSSFGRMGPGIELNTVLQLYITTGEKQYSDKFEELLWPALNTNVIFNITPAIHALPHLDASYKEKLRPYVEKYKVEYLDSISAETPYGVPVGTGFWAGSDGVSSFGITSYLIHKQYPDILGPENVFKALDFLFGNHPYHNLSLVATVGARHKEVFYGQNRADFTFTPGVVAPGVLFAKPDHFENYDDWPFLWAQNEGTKLGAVTYIFLGKAAQDLLK